MRRTPAIVLMLALVTVASPHASAQGCAWQLVDSPDPGPVVELTDVVTISESDAWAVGGFTDGGEFSRTQTLAIHWDGTEWSRVDTPSVSASHEHRIKAVSASGPDDVWAVGITYPTADRDPQARAPNEPLGMHWDGESWQIVPIPKSTPGATVLTDVIARDPNDVWVSGARTVSSGGEKSLVLHFDGTEWRRIPSGNKPDQFRALYAVTATEEAVWFAGTRGPKAARPSHPYALRYRTGTRETFRMPSPPDATYPMPTGVTAASETDLWTVGQYFVPNSTEVFARRFNGVRWQEAPTPPVGSGGINDFKGLTGLDSVGPTDVWASGYQTSRPDGSFRSDGLVARWDGSDWMVESLPQDSSGTLEEIDMLSANSGWAVGTIQLDHSDSEPSFAPPSDGLIVRYVCE